MSNKKIRKEESVGIKINVGRRRECINEDGCSRRKKIVRELEKMH